MKFSKNLLPVLAPFLLLSCQQKSLKQVIPPQIDQRILITCDGIGEVKITDSYQDLEKRFGAKALSEHENTEIGHFTSLWENDRKQINIVWTEKRQPYKHIKYMEATDSFSIYMTKDSLRAGMTLRELVKINGHIGITFRNFYTERKSGLIASFNGGNIEKMYPCLGATLTNAGQHNVHVSEQKAFMKKELVESSDHLLERIQVAVSTIRVTSKQ